MKTKYVNGVNLTGNRAFNPRPSVLLSWTIGRCKLCGRFLKKRQIRPVCRRCVVLHSKEEIRIALGE